MERSKVLEKVQEIFKDVFDQDNLIINEETSASDIEEWDSLMHINILESIQNEFGIVFELNEIVEMKNVGEIINSILKNK